MNDRAALAAVGIGGEPPRAAATTAAAATAAAVATSGAVAPTGAEATGATVNALDTSSLTGLVGYAASRAALEMRKVFAAHMKPLRLTVVEFSLLVLVADNPEVNQKQLGAALDISAPKMGITLDGLAERGWVQRVRSERDRRAQHIHLTPSGHELVQRARSIAATMENEALRVLTTAERALLIELLLKVASRRGASGPRPGSSVVA